ncbi:MAG: alpha/beta hydrolase [Burkholderiales bacterium]|nr:alpha/beta hydrolase [Burkholderiales bacterium]
MDLAAELARALARPGIAAVPYADAAFPDRPVTVHAYRAPGHAPGKPCVLVQHGMGRNGDEYRDFWIAAADRHGLLILATTFADDAWPGPEHYNNGAVLTEDGAVRPPGRRAYDIPGRVLAAARAAGLTDGRDVRLFGHSAGAQFVHRLVASGAAAPAVLIAANAGWYTLPTLDRPFPEGLGGIGLGEDDLARFLAAPLHVLAGDADTETAGPSLPAHPAALAQGPHRFARARAFVAAGGAAAASRGLACAWRLTVVPGIGHDGAAMSRVAAGLWFDGLEAARAAERARTATTDTPVL